MPCRMKTSRSLRLGGLQGKLDQSDHLNRCTQCPRGRGNAIVLQWSPHHLRIRRGWWKLQLLFVAGLFIALSTGSPQVNSVPLCS